MQNGYVSLYLRHLFWIDNRDGYWGEVYHRASADAGASWSADERLTFDAQPSDRPTGCMWDSTVAVLWKDNMPGNWEVYFKRDTLDVTGLSEVPGRLTAQPDGESRPTRQTLVEHHIHAEDGVQGQRPDCVPG